MCFSSLLRLLAGIVGSYLAYATFVMTESAEGIWQNRLEKLWINVDDQSKTSLSRTQLLFQKLSSTVAIRLTKLFGNRIVSLRLVGVSGSLSISSFFLTLGIGLGWLLSLISKYADKVSPDLHRDLPLLALVDLVLIAIGSFCLILAILPVLFRSSVWSIMSCIPIALLMYSAVNLARRHSLTGDQVGLLLALLISLITDIIVIIAIRRSLRWLAEHATVYRISIVLALQISAAFLVLTLPYKVAIHTKPSHKVGVLAQALFVLATFNTPTAVICLALALLLLLLFLHRSIWPVISQLTYGLAQRKMLENRKTLRTFGFVLIAFALGSGSNTQRFLEKIFR